VRVDPKKDSGVGLATGREDNESERTTKEPKQTLIY
jgi:hypothetical protein